MVLTSSLSPRADRHLKLHLESLENRQLLAGDVEVRVTGGGDLRLDGDDESNQVSLLTLPNGDMTVVGNDGTTINGAASQTFSGVTDDVRVNLRDGNNLLLLDGTRIPDRLTVRTGDGSDVLFINPQDQDVVIGGNVSINLGDGDNSLVSLEGGVEVAGRMSVRMGDGIDDITLRSIAMNDRVRINTGDGSDDVAISSGQMAARSRFNLGSGDDRVLLKFGQFTDLRINGNSGDDEFVDATNAEVDIRNIETVSADIC